MNYLTKAGVKLINEGRRRSRSQKSQKVKDKLLMPGETPLTPQGHDDRGRTPNVELRAGLEDMKPRIKRAKDKNKDLAYGREGDVAGTRGERLARAYAQRLARGGKKASRKIVRTGKTKEPIKGWQGKVTGFSLEHPDTDPKNKGNRLSRILTKSLGGADQGAAATHSFLRGAGTKTKADPSARRGLKKLGVSPDENNPQTFFRHSFARTDPSQTRPGQLTKGQEIINRVRRMGVRRTVKKKKKEGYEVIGTMGSGHMGSGQWTD